MMHFFQSIARSTGRARKLGTGAILLAALLTAGCSGGGDADTGPKSVTLKLGHVLDPSHPVQAAMEQMAKRAAELTGDRLKIDLYPSGTLGSERELVESLQLGTVDIAKVSCAQAEAFVPIHGVFSLPYIFRDEAHFWNTLEGPIGEEMLRAGEDVGLTGLCFYDSGSRSFYGKKPINSPEDLVGLKIRVMQGKTVLDTIRALGGSPTPIPWGELYGALQSGVVDAAENNPPSLYTSAHFEVCKFYSLNEHMMIPDIVLASKATMDRLDPDLRAALLQAAHESVAFEREVWKTFTEESLQKLQEAGVTIIHPDKAPFRAKVEGMYAEYDGTPIGDLLARIREVQ
jgi:tripartite ATP-independent transporter DctP family solute receptor